MVVAPHGVAWRVVAARALPKQVRTAKVTARPSSARADFSFAISRKAMSRLKTSARPAKPKEHGDGFGHQEDGLAHNFALDIT